LTTIEADFVSAGRYFLKEQERIMGNRIRHFGWMVSFALVVFLPVAGGVRADAQQPAMDRIQQLETDMAVLNIQLDQMYRRVPTCEGIEEEPMMKAWAEKAGELEKFRLVSVGKNERLQLTDGQPSSFLMRRLEISGRDPYEKIDQFLQRLRLRSRLILLESLNVEAAAGGTVDYTARLALPCYQDVEMPAKSERETMEAWMAGRVSWLRGQKQLLQDMEKRADPGGLIRALNAFDARSAGQALALTRLRSGPELVLEGVVGNAQSRELLRPSLEAAGFRDAQIRMAPARGTCETFSVTARLDAPQETEEATYTFGNGLFDAGRAAACPSQP
jgi:hypothetical protein